MATSISTNPATASSDGTDLPKGFRDSLSPNQREHLTVYGRKGTCTRHYTDVLI